MAATRTKVIDLAKELGVTSRDLMRAAEEMGHTGLRVVSPLAGELANSLRVKFGRGRELPSEATRPKRASRSKATAAPVPEASQAAAPGVVEVVDEPRPAAVILKPRPELELPIPEVASVPGPSLPPREPVVEAAPAPPGESVPPTVLAPAATLTPSAPPAAVVPPARKAEPRIVPYRPPERPGGPAARPPGRPFQGAFPGARSGAWRPRAPFTPVPPLRPSAPRPAPVPQRAEPLAPEPRAEAPARRETVRVTETVTVGELAEKLRRKSGEVIRALVKLGVMATVNQMLDQTAAKLVAGEFGVDLEIRSLEGDVLAEDENDPGQLQPRPPVVTVMGHVDHGKTSLLDRIRRTSVADREFGGITQHIGAYQATTRHGRVTFIDTPGHAAFTAMRARGAQATDIVILVVAADDGVMPQTLEAISHARAANVPIVVAMNKIDKPEADPERVKRELSNHGLVPEDWGGQTIYVPTSAKTGTGVDQLLELAALQAEVLELKANPGRAARGVIIESRLDRGRGPAATVLVQHGTLREGDAVVVGAHSGRIRALVGQQGQRVESAGPSDPVEIVGLSGIPAAGDVLVAVADERAARQIALARRDAERAKAKATPAVTLAGLQERMQAGEIKEYRLVLKGDVQGSVEALETALEQLATGEVRPKVIHSGVGAVTETDVALAKASGAIVLAFNVKPGPQATAHAQERGVEIRQYNIIYEALNDIRAALEGLLAPEIREVAVGHAEVRQIFVISRLGPIAGSYVQEGRIVRGARARVRRRGEVLGEGTVGSLRRFKDDVREVAAGFECGIGIEGVTGLEAGDIIEVYTTEEVARSL